jgi:LmbE family N-acetylglucosaminyl deacetylase
MVPRRLTPPPTSLQRILESELIPYTASTRLSARAVLVLAPHPDDEVFGCGGAIATHVRDGIPVSVVILTDGAEFGDAGLRRRESEAAAQTLSYGQPEFWQLPDRGLYYSDALAQRLTDKITQTGCDLVYAPSPWEIHPDHRQAHALALEAVRRAGGPVRLALYEIGNPLRANTLLDITTTAAAKEAAMACFASQLAKQDYRRQMIALNQFRTYTLPPEVCAAEAYWVGTPAELDQACGNRLFGLVSSGPAASSGGAAPLVSVVVRSMDRPLLAQALDSVALQTYPNIEVLVVAATPGHQALPSRCGRSALKLIPTDKPLSRSQAANKGLAHAQGEYLLLLDDDDWLMPSHIARLAQVLAAQPQAWAAYTGISLVDAHARPMGQVFDLPYDAVRQTAGNITPIHAVLFSAKTLSQGCRFDEALDHYEDWDFWLQLAQLGPFMHLPGVSAVYRIHDSSGVHADPGPLGANAGRIYDKWQAQWTPARRGELMRRVWSHTELLQELGEARDTIQAGQKHAASLDASIAQQSQTLTQQQQLLHTQNQQIAQLTDTLGAQGREIANQLSVIAQLRLDFQALLGSTSWRLTRPVRWLGQLARRLKS